MDECARPIALCRLLMLSATKQAEQSSIEGNKTNTIVVGFLIHLCSLQVGMEEVDKRSFEVKQFLVCADLRDSTIGHHNDLVELRQKTDAVCDQDACLAHHSFAWWIHKLSNLLSV